MRRPIQLLFFTRITFTWLALALVGLEFQKLQGREIVRENAREFFGSADLNGNGRSDLVLADRATGQIRIGEQQANGTFQWSQGQFSGLPSIDGMALGPWQTNQDTLIVSSGSGNRLAQTEFTNGLHGAVFQPIHLPSGVSPQALALVPARQSALSILRPGLFAISNLNQPHPWRWEVVRPDSGHPSGLATIHEENPANLEYIGKANRLSLSTVAGRLPYLAFLTRTGSVNRFQLLDTAGANYSSPMLLQLPGDARNTEYLTGFFGPEGNLGKVLLLFGKDQSELFYGLVRDSPSNSAPVLPDTFKRTVFSFRIKEAIVLEEGIPGRILLLQNDGKSAAIYTFSYEDGFVLHTEITATGKDLYSGAIASGKGGFALLRGDGRTPSNGFDVYLRDKESYLHVQSAALPTLMSDSASRNNLFLFSSEPFLDPSAQPVAALRFGDWTTEANLRGSAVEFLEWQDSGPEAGLGAANNTVLPSLPSNAKFALGNQNNTEDFSLVSLAPGWAETARTLQFQPAPGVYDHPISLVLSSPLPGGVISYRINGGEWMKYSAPLNLFRDSTVEAYSQNADSLKSRIGMGSYRFEVSDPLKDSNGDGIPDFVRLYFGLDPYAATRDSDGDGFSDLEEILQGTDPTNPDSFPGVINTSFRPKESWSLLLRPLSHDPSVYPKGTIDLLKIGTGMPGQLFRTNGVLLGGVSADPRGIMFFSKLTSDPFFPWSVAATGSRFSLQEEPDGLFNGVELVGMVPETVLTLPRLDSFSLTNDDIGEQVDRWRALMTSLLLNASHVHQQTIEPIDTLVFAMVEAWVGRVLFERNVTDTEQINLAPFRLQGQDRQAVDLSPLRELQAPPATSNPAYDFSAVMHFLRQEVRRDDHPGLRLLRLLVREIYHLPTLVGHKNPRYELPLDGFRHFLRTGQLPGAWQEDTAMDASSLQIAWTSAIELIDNVPTRPLLEFVLAGPQFDPPSSCVYWHDTGSDQRFVLVGRSGKLYRPDLLGSLPAGSVLRVHGYADRLSPCGDSAIEVVVAVVDTLPQASSMDADGNMLPDSWEKYFFGTTGIQPWADASGNGYSNFQHLLEGVDPFDPMPLPGAPALLTSFPVISSTPMENGTWHLSWSWPDQYAEKVQFKVELGETLTDFTDTGLLPSYNADSQAFEVVVPLPTDGMPVFFQVRIQLR